jgi:hypothetical protein
LRAGFPAMTKRTNFDGPGLDKTVMVHDLHIAARGPGRYDMENQEETYPFTFEAVREKAPSASGVYRIYTAHRWVYVGESDDIRQSLFRHLNEPGAPMHRYAPLSFSFELATAATRKGRREVLIEELEPACPAA